MSVSEIGACQRNSARAVTLSRRPAQEGLLETGEPRLFGTVALPYGARTKRRPAGLRHGIDDLIHQRGSVDVDHHEAILDPHARGPVLSCPSTARSGS